jgi:hypothetical protein
VGKTEEKYKTDDRNNENRPKEFSLPKINFLHNEFDLLEYNEYTHPIAI